MKTKQLLRILAIQTLLLLTGIANTWAWDHQDTFSDEGGEQCVFRYSGPNMTYSNMSLGASDIRGFKTHVKFDNLNGSYHWEFHLRVCFKSICNKSNTDRLNTSIKGTMYVITDDNVSHKLCDYAKSKGSDKVVVSNENLDYGRVIINDETRNGWLEVKLLPCNRLLNEGFKRVRFSNDRLICSENRSWGPFEYEKETGTNYAFLPEPSFSWDSDGKVRVVALGVPNGIDHPSCRSQLYAYNCRGLVDNNINAQQFLNSGNLAVKEETVTRKDNNRVDVATYQDIDNQFAYTSPLWFYTDGLTRVKPLSELRAEDWEQEFEPFLLTPFTHPTELTVLYDQWNQMVNVQWTYQRNVELPTTTSTSDYIDCRTDGKWYLLRREKSKTTYTLLNTYESTLSQFNFADDGCAIDKEYVYRVVFLPSVLGVGNLQSPTADDLVALPFSNLCVEVTVSTVPEVPVLLSQNRADEEGVSLYWEYNIQDPDAKFSVQRTTPGGSSWTTIARDISVNLGQPYATYVDQTVSSPCEFYSYRVMAQTLGREFASNVIEGNLPAGSRITAVEASKGTEERNVIVKWQVRQRGTDDTWFSLRRRILGSNDDWNEIGTTHGTAQEYTFIDDRVMAGSYYEYAVVAYSKVCNGQDDGDTPSSTMSDFMTAAGFSQARGTITGHVSYGTGTAVSDVRVSLVKTTEGDGEDVQQYLSRYIEGEGKGLYWEGDSSRFAAMFNSQRPLSLQLWAQPANGGAKMQLARLENAIELGLRRADDTTPYTYQRITRGQVRSLEPSEMVSRVSGGTSGINGSSEGNTKLYDGDLNTKMRIKMGNNAHSSMRTTKDLYVTSYVLTTASDAAQYPECNPRSWTIKARAEKDKEMKIVATVTGDTKMEGRNSTAYEYQLDQPGYYKYFEIQFLETQGSDIVQLAEMTYKTMEDIEETITIDDVTVSDGSTTEGDSSVEGNQQSVGGDLQSPTYHLYVIDLSNPNYAVTEFPNLTFKDRSFTHVAALYSDGQWTFHVGSDALRVGTMTSAARWNAFSVPDGSVAGGDQSPSTLSFGGSRRLLGSAYKGWVDDVRLWNRQLSNKDLQTNYTRMLGGTESGLMLYWPLDEGLQVKKYAFDVACQEGIYMLNHPTVGVNATPSTHVPDKLMLYGLTDRQGDYIVRGIPFQQGGTNYKVVPMLGIHEFNPNTRSMFISPTSLTANNVDFEDVSAFPMAGYVYYAGTNIPAQGIELYVDGELLTANGKVKQTDVKGYYEISVPIGNHYVEAKLEGHTMVAGGRFPTQGTFNFDRRVQYDFTDSTLVNFVGRVSGGLCNDTLPVGFGASRNNIGMATIQLKLNNESSLMNCQDDHISDATTVRYWASDTTSINSRSWSGTGYDAKYVYIRTDSITGEFSALLPPLKYITKSIHIAKNPDVEFSDLPQIDLSFVKTVARDSLKQATAGGDSIINYYSYNTKMVRTWFAEPQLEVNQALINGEANTPKGVFGLKEIKNYTDDFGTDDILDIWKKDEDGNYVYTYGYPIYGSDDRVKMSVRGYEAYSNYDSGTAVTDTIPLNGQVLTIVNELSDEQMVVTRTNEELGLQPGDIYDVKTGQLQLDVNGRNEFKWTSGLPNIISPYTRRLSINYERNGRTRVWEGINAVVLGSINEGNNFVTLGPDLVTMVLRDPPGATSKTTWTTGHTETKVRSTAHGFYGDEKWTVDMSSGVSGYNLAGIGVMVKNEITATTDGGTGFHYSVKRDNQTDRTWSVSTTKSVSTGTGLVYVGRAGDVFIGASTNLIVGDCRKLGFFRQGEGYPYVLDLRNAKSLGDSIRTSFMYSTHELENVMIPKWEDTRRSLMTFVDSKAEALNYVNTSNRSVYVTWLSKDDPNVGVSDTTYYQVPPAGWDGSFIDDSVRWCTTQINSWRDVMKANEEDKVAAMKSTEYFLRNISFDGGTSHSYTSRNDTTYQKRHNYQHNLGGIVKLGGTSENSIPGFKFSVKTMWDTENGWTMATSESDYDENTQDWAQLEYTFSDGNRGTDFSVNIYKSTNGWSDIFSLLGGQSYNPYEGEERTKYFEAGKHILSNGTQQMEQPDIRISVDGNESAKTATLTDVPAGQAGQFTLHLTNLGMTHQDFDFIFNLVVQEKADTLGLEVFMDGFPANGRSIYLPAGETVKKIITVKQSDESVLDYEGIEILMLSQFEPLVINDKVTFDVHFKPSSSPVDLVIGEPVLNIETLERGKGNLEMKVTNFDRQFSGMKKVGVEYRYEGATTWTQPAELTFFVNPKDTASNSGHVLPATGDLRLKFDMGDDNFYPQGAYTFRAYTTTMYDSEPISVYSSEVTVVKDDERPRNLTTPAPANGILRYGDDLIVEFNEDIVPGFVSDKNVIVTAKLNNQPVNHDVAAHLSRRGGCAHTENPIFLNGDFSAEFWLNRESDGTILQLGNGNNQFSLGFSDNHALLRLAGAEMISQNTVPLDEWTFFALSYKASDHTFTLLAQFGKENVYLFENEVVPVEGASAINYSDDNRLLLGPITASIHDLCLFKVFRDVSDAAASKYKSKDNYVYGLTNYWPMNEGHGNLIADTRHTHDITLNDTWQLENTNYWLETDGGDGVEADLTSANTSRGDSYAIELWAKSENEIQGGETLFETGSNAANRLRLYFNTQKDLMLDYGENSQKVASATDFPYVGDVSHYALNVVRGQSAGFYLNGQRTAVIHEAEVPPVQGATMRIGQNLKGCVDEIRVWRATLSENRLLSNMYNCIDTTDIYSRGLVAYYPFEKAGTVNGVETKVPTVENMVSRSVSGNPLPLSMNGEPVYRNSMAPLKNAPVEGRLIAKPVTSDRKLVIRLEEGNGITARDVEGTTLNITVDKIHDMHGNESAPIRWTAFVQLNTLKWLKDSVNVIMKYGDGYTFDVNIENRGGNTEYYTLCNMPQWLTLVDSERSDNLDPLSSKTLRFRVSPLTPVGNYDVTIGLQGNNEILEPLRIVMRVSGEKPYWNVDPSKYENTMSIAGQVYINGILMGNSESCVAAFIDDECRGIASPEQVRGAAYVAMTVFGTAQQEVNGGMEDLDKGKPVTFRIWDATTGVAYTNVNVVIDGAPVDITFDPTVNYGTFDTPVVFTRGNDVEQGLSLKQGWNWLSLGVEPANTATSVVFKDLSTWNVRIKDKTTGTAYCNGTYWAGTLNDIHANTMYKLLLNRLSRSTDLPQPLPVAGRQVKLAETPITLHEGWNWIAFLPTTTMTLDDALAGANPQTGDQVKSQTGFAYYGIYGWEGNLKALESGKGYLYQSVDPTTKTFVYPSITTPTHRHISARKPEKRQSAFMPVAPADYPDNMSMVIKLTSDGQPVADAEIAAFIGGECRGATFADSPEVEGGDDMQPEPLYYLLVAGEGSGQPIEISANWHGRLLTLCNNLTYSSDGNIGTPWEPLVLDIGTTTGISSLPEGYVPGVWYTLQGIRIGNSRPSVPGIYIYNGQKVVVDKIKKASVK